MHIVIMTKTMNISVDDKDYDLIKEKHWKASKIFRRAMFLLRAQQLDIEADLLIDPLNEIVKLRNVVGAQNITIKEQSQEVKRLASEGKNDLQTVK